MHRIWIVNLEEVIGHGVIMETLYQHIARYLHFVRPGDLFISSVDIDDDFINYVIKLNGLHEDRRWYVRLEKLSVPYYGVDSILLDDNLKKMLTNLSSTGSYVIDSFIETPRIVELSRITQLPAPGTDGGLVRQGLIKKLNEKTFFRELSRELNIPIARGFCAFNPGDVRKALQEICQSPLDMAVMKKSFSGGGYGNLMGSRELLTGAVPSWCDGGEYVVEEMLDLEETIGSLVVLNDDYIEFVGTNSQIIQRCSWKGCRYPYYREAVTEQVEKLSLCFGRRIHRMGARGLLNVDWGLTWDGGLYAIEINLRRNGFNYILQSGRQNFAVNPKEMHLLYLGSFPLAPGFDSFKQVLGAVREIQIDGEPVCEPGRKLPRGIIFTTPVKEGRIGVLIGGSSRQEVDRVESAISERIRGNE